MDVYVIMMKHCLMGKALILRLYRSTPGLNLLGLRLCWFMAQTDLFDK